MFLARRCVLPIALTLVFVALFPEFTSAQSAVEIYPGPGVDTYKSTLYAVEVFNGTNWIPAHVYAYSRKSVCHWHFGTYPTVNFLTFGTSGPVDVRVTKLNGPIRSVDASPHSKHRPGYFSGGQIVGTLQPNDKVWLTINEDDANPLFIFADALKPAVPAGATYFGPGVRDISSGTGNHYKASTNEVIYLDGGAWVRGNIDVRGTSNVQIMGPGVLSGDLWTGETVGANALPFTEFTNYAMITGDWLGGDGTGVRGITIVDSPGYNVFGGATSAYSVKILSPWFYSTDGFGSVSHVDQCFIFNGDNAFGPGAAGVQNADVVITSSFAGTTNNSVFAGGYWGFEAKAGYTAFVDDIDIKTYNNDDWVTSPSKLLAAAFQVFVDNGSSSAGYSNQTYQNIRIEGNLSVPLLEMKNLLYIWAPAGSASAPNPPLGNSSNFVFRNISLEGTSKYRSEIKGLDAGNGFHNVVLDNVSIGGTPVTTANLSQYFDVNPYVWGLTVTDSGARCVADATTLCLGNGRFAARVAWSVPSQGRSGVGAAVPLSGDTGYFWFFNDANLELVIKALDGVGVNGHFWVFYGALSDVQYTITVTDTVTGAVKHYENPAGALASAADTSAFSPSGASLGAPPAASAEEVETRAAKQLRGLHEELAQAVVLPKAATAGACTPGGTMLCLNQSRFQVTVDWAVPSQGSSGHGMAVPRTSDTGYFWFFSSANIELVIKVLDGRGVNGHFWVFYGALSDVEYTITVKDTQTGLVKTYENHSGTLASAADTSAF